MTRNVRILVAALLVAATIALAACATSSGSGGGTGNGSSSAMEPGTYPKRGGRVEVVGTLVRQELEGGFWSIVKSTPDATSGAETIAVIANGDQLSTELEELTGSYVLARGTPLEGASIRMAGPEITADVVQKIPTP